MKRLTPYARLLTAVQEYVSRVKYPRRTLMWVYPKDKLGEHWDMAGLYSRVAAADQIGHDVRLRADETGLRVEYVKRAEDIDYFID